MYRYVDSLAVVYISTAFSVLCCSKLKAVAVASYS